MDTLLVPPLHCLLSEMFILFKCHVTFERGLIMELVQVLPEEWRTNRSKIWVILNMEYITGEPEKDSISFLPETMNHDGWASFFVVSCSTSRALDPLRILDIQYLIITRHVFGLNSSLLNSAVAKKRMDILC